MSSKKGFTLVELMVVILIVAILAAVAIPIMRGRIDAAKWSEGKAMMGTIATAVRAYCAEYDEATTLDLTALSWEQLGFHVNDLKGTYFDRNKFSIIGPASYDSLANDLVFVIHAEKGTGINLPEAYTLDQSGVWEIQGSIM